MTNPVSVDIKDKLVAAGLGTFATDLFIGKEPATPEDCVTIYDTGGFEPDEKFALDNLTFQIRSRHTDYLTGHNKLDLIKNELISSSKSSINESTYIGIWGSGDIQFLSRDENDLCIFTMNFRCVRTPKDKGNRI